MINKNILSMNNFFKIIFFSFMSLISLIMISENNIEAQDIPELHMLVLQGDVIIGTSNTKTSSLDGYLLEAKIDNEVVASVEIGKNLSGRYSGLEIGPNLDLEGKTITFSIGDEIAMNTAIFGPLTPSGEYCRGCTWSLPISRTLNLNFNQIPLPTPTPAPASVQPTFLTGTVIFGSVLSAPEGERVIYAYIDDEIIGVGEVKEANFSITLDPGNENYLGKSVIFKISDYQSKTTYIFEDDQFVTDFKLFFPEYIPPTATPTPVPLATAIPTFTPTPEPTRTATPVPEPTPTYTPTPTPTPIAINTSTDILTEDSDGGCNSRGGGPASVSLILLSLVPAYVLNRKRRIR